MPYLDYRLGRGSRKMPDYASISGHFARCFAYFARGSGVIVICSEITDCCRLAQNRACCYYLLVVKLIVKRKFLLLKKEEEQVFLHISRYLRTHAKLLLDYFLIFKHAVLVHSNDYHILALQT